MKKLSDFREEYLKLGTKNNLKGKEALEAVKTDGYNLQFVTEQTEEICLEAVKQEGTALQYVNEQTEEICLAAVKQDHFALKYVNEDILFNGTVKVVVNGKEIFISKEALVAVKEIALGL